LSEATTDRKTLPNSAPEANTASGCGLITGKRGCDSQQGIQQGEGAAAAVPCSSAAHSHDDAITPTPSTT
jgi:hypothetical protein